MTPLFAILGYFLSPMPIKNCEKIFTIPKVFV
jgi:hypothetical protein